MTYFIKTDLYQVSYNLFKGIQAAFVHVTHYVLQKAVALPRTENEWIGGFLEGLTKHG